MKAIINNDTEHPVPFESYNRRFVTALYGSPNALSNIEFLNTKQSQLDQFMNLQRFKDVTITKVQVFDNDDNELFTINCTEAQLDDLNYTENSSLRTFQATGIISIYQL